MHRHDIQWDSRYFDLSNIGIIQWPIGNCINIDQPENGPNSDLSENGPNIDLSDTVIYIGLPLSPALSVMLLNLFEGYQIIYFVN